MAKREKKEFLVIWRKLTVKLETTEKLEEQHNVEERTKQSGKLTQPLTEGDLSPQIQVNPEDQHLSEETIDQTSSASPGKAHSCKLQNQWES